MDMPLWIKITTALFMGFMLWRIFPAARHWLENGPKGSSKEWLTTSMLLGGVVLFVALLVLLVRA